MIGPWAEGPVSSEVVTIHVEEVREHFLRRVNHHGSGVDMAYSLNKQSK